MVGMFLSGEFDHTLDPKGRVTLPARYREYFQKGAVLVRLPNREPCISVFSPDSWVEFDQKYLEGRDFFDKQGRVLLSAQSIKDLCLSGKVKILGVRTHLEIWDPETLAAAEQGRLGDDA
jgi:MraZ protein